ncbi:MULTISPECIES: S9 family peptidase [Kordiimonas]|uniref:S9 family peptidase n=1 Tax=Kordiimonas TaxID=288021 RepID=UPI0025810765|nr:alpha/beta fold hydrolase [Kordiimonas sp. UBA4487]
MTPFQLKARIQVTCALMLAAASLFAAPAPVAADTLDDAIQTAKSQSEAPLLSRSLLLKKRQIDYVRLSPSGAFLAYSLKHGRHMELWLYDVASETHKRLFASELVDQIFWSTDSRYLFLESSQGVAAVSMGTPDTPAFILNLDSDSDELLYRVDPSQPHAVIVSKAATDGGHDFFRLLPDSTKELLFQSSTFVGDVLPGTDGVYFAVRIAGDGLELVRIQGDTAKRLQTCSLDDRCKLIAYDQATDSLLVQGTFGQNLTGLYRMDATDGTVNRLHQDPGGMFDIKWVIMDTENQPRAAGYLDDHISFYGLDAGAQQAIAKIEAELGAEQLMLRASDDLTRWLAVDDGIRPPKIALYDRMADNFTYPMEHITAEDRDLLKSSAAIRVPIWYSVSDGMRQQGYVTLPRGKNPADAPLVIVPHGGPWGRVDGTYDTRAQFLANRGYAVFEPNFRASTGFGKQYTLSANRDFGDGRVQQDIIDGMEYVLSRGIGDRTRLGIFGHSFGGFSVLGAMAFTPETFRVGIAGAPPVDLSKAIKYFTNMDRSPAFALRLKRFKKLTVDLNDPADVRRIQSQSPDAHWQKISRPLYIWAGEKDPKVSVLNVRDYVLRLQGNTQPVSYLEEPRAGHSPNSALAMEAYFYMVEKALADHLGGRLEIGGGQKLKRHLKRVLLIDENALTE